jgi:hypothetical protein
MLTRHTSSSRRTPALESLESRRLLSGTVLDQFRLDGGSAQANSLVEDAAGNLFALGRVADATGASAQHGIVRERAAGSSQWQTVLNYNLTPGQYTSFNDAVADPATGDMFITGSAQDAAGTSHWITLKRSAEGAVSTLDNYQYPGTTLAASGNSIARDAAGNLFTVGYALDGARSGSGNSGSLLYRWIVRELRAGQSDWTTVQSFRYQSAWNSVAGRIAVTPSGIYVVGNAFPPSGTGHWLTQKGTTGANGQVAWTTVDDFTADLGAGASDVGTDTAGNLYVVGSGTVNTGTARKPVSAGTWFVRRSPDAGATWTTVDRFRLSGTRESDAHSFTADTSGNLYVTGMGQDANGIYHSIVRTSQGGGGTWSTLDDWQLAPGKIASAYGLLVDHANTLYTAGRGNDADNTQYWIVRQIAPPATATFSPFSTATIADTSSPLDEVLA